MGKTRRVFIDLVCVGTRILVLGSVTEQSCIIVVWELSVQSSSLIRCLCVPPRKTFIIATCRIFWNKWRMAALQKILTCVAYQSHKIGLTMSQMCCIGGVSQTYSNFNDQLCGDLAVSNGPFWNIFCYRLLSVTFFTCLGWTASPVGIRRSRRDFPHKSCFCIW